MIPAESRPRLGRLGVAAALALFAAAAVAPYAELRPNRIARGTPVGLTRSAAATFGLTAAVAALGFSAAAARGSPVGGSYAVPRFLTRFSALTLLAAPGLMASSSGFPRASPGPGFWLAAAGLAIAWRSGARVGDPVAGGETDPVSGAKLEARLALVIDLASVAALIVLSSGGFLDSFSPYAEFKAQGPRFWTELARHVGLSSVAFLTAAVLAVPTAALAARNGPSGTALTALAGAAQNIPSLALFGLLLPALAALADALPGLRKLGITGIGPAPAIVALTLYALLPMVLSGAAGLAMADPGAKDAAKGMGYSPRQAFWRVELPLALPSFLSGARTALVQTIGTATVAALVGAGGMGYFIFQGLGQAAMDMVIIGVVPVVALSALTDRLMGGLQTRAERYVR